MSKWQGTPVPTSGVVEKVYFNTALSVDEVVGLLENLTLNYDGQGEILTASSLNEEETAQMICILKMSETCWFIQLNTYTDSEILFMSSDVFDLGYVGWNPNITYPIVLGYELQSSLESEDDEGNVEVVPIGTQNDLLSSLFSTTPFVQEKVTLNSFLTSIADAIRSKKGTTEPINASNFASEIEKIQTGIEPTGTLDITENGEHNVREYENVNVDVKGGSVFKEYIQGRGTCNNLFASYKNDNLSDIINYSDTEGITNFGSMYNGCQASSVPLIDTSKGTDFSNMYRDCRFIKTFPLIDTSNGTAFNGMYKSGISATEFPLINTSKGTAFYNMYEGCYYTTSFPQLNTSNGTNFGSMYSGCKAATIFPAIDVRNGTNFGSMYNGCKVATSILMYGMKKNFDVSSCNLLEAEALVTILSNCQVITSTQKITMGSTLLAKLNGVYVKETGVEQYEGITCKPCVICESTDTGAMLATDYITGKGWTLA